MPRAVAMFEQHGLNPHYFANPPALHLPAALPARASGYGGATGVLHAFAAAPRPTCTRSRASPPRVLGTARAVAAVPDRRAPVRPRRRAARGGDRGGRVPARLLRAPGAQRRAHARAADAVAAGQRGRAAQRPRARLPARRASGWGSPARASTRPGSCSCRSRRRSPRAICDGGPGAGRGAPSAASRSRARRRWSAFLLANPYALLDFQRFHSELVHQSTLSAEAQGKLGAPKTGRPRLLPVVAHLGPRLGARAGRARRGGDASGARERRPRLAARAGAAPVPRVHGPAGPLLRPLAAADLPDPLPAGARSSRCTLTAAIARRAWRARASSARERDCAVAAALAAVDRVAAAARQGLVYSVHSDLVLARADTRNLTRAWMVAHIPPARAIVVEPVAPDAWAHERGPGAREPATAIAGASTPRCSR